MRKIVIYVSCSLTHLFFYENSIMEEFSELKKRLEFLHEHFYKEK